MTSAFHHCKEITDYTTRLGKLTRDHFDDLQVGDTVAIVNKVFGLNLSSTGKVVEFIEHIGLVKELATLEYDECVCLVKENWENISRIYPLCGQPGGEETLFQNAKSCIVEISERVTFTAENLIWISANCPDIDISELSNPDVDRLEIKMDGIDLLLNRFENNVFDVNVRVRSLLDGTSVLSTEAIDAYNRDCIQSSEVENVAWSDEIIPDELLAELNVIVDSICELEREDYHPGSGNVVRDIVHPSLYCYVKNVSKVRKSPLSGYEKARKIPKHAVPATDFWGRQYEVSNYQWLPSEFVVDESGKVSINSYINNLDKDKYPKAYDLIADVFAHFVPMFESVCGCLKNNFYGDGKSDEEIVIPLRNRRLQVVTKIVEYRVNSEENFDGVWHVEGMSHENILATGLLIFKRDDTFTGAEISFKRYLFEMEGDNLMYNTPQFSNRPTEMMEGGDVRPLGTLATPYGRAMVFPNSHIHKLSNMNSSDGKDSTRRILVFWLVNPDTPIVSTANVSRQQDSMTFDDAKKYQLALMAERKLHKDTFNTREVYLCEH